jgi:hypothetical protein
MVRPLISQYYPYMRPSTWMKLINLTIYVNTQSFLVGPKMNDEEQGGDFVLDQSAHLLTKCTHSAKTLPRFI